MTVCPEEAMRAWPRKCASTCGEVMSKAPNTTAGPCQRDVAAIAS